MHSKRGTHRCIFGFGKFVLLTNWHLFLLDVCYYSEFSVNLSLIGSRYRGNSPKPTQNSAICVSTRNERVPFVKSFDFFFLAGR